MGLREDLVKRIDRKSLEVKELELQIREANSYIQGLQDVLKIIPRDGSDDKRAELNLRPNSDMAKARDFLRKVSTPMHVGEILKGIGKGDSKPNRLSLSGSLGDYVRKGEIFTRPAPNTFGLTEFESKGNAVVVSEPPENFGIGTIINSTDNEPEDNDPFSDQ